MTRQKKTMIFVAATGLSAGLAAILLWPYIKKRFFSPSITIGKGRVTSKATGWLMPECPSGQTWDRDIYDASGKVVCIPDV